MAHTQKPDFVFRRNGRIHLNRQERQFSRLLTAEVCASAVVMLDTPCSEEVWRVLATHYIRQFHLHFPSRASPCAITFHLDSNYIRDSIECGRNWSWPIWYTIPALACIWYEIWKWDLKDTKQDFECDIVNLRSESHVTSAHTLSEHRNINTAWLEGLTAMMIIYGRCMSTFRKDGMLLSSGWN